MTDDGKKARLGCGSCLGPNEWTDAYGAVAGWQPVPEQQASVTLRGPDGATRIVPNPVPWQPCACNPRREAFEAGELRPTKHRAPETPAARAAREVARRQAEAHDYA
jgi:hypothetical protein